MQFYRRIRRLDVLDGRFFYISGHLEPNLAWGWPRCVIHILEWLALAVGQRRRLVLTLTTSQARSQLSKKWKSSLPDVLSRTTGVEFRRELHLSGRGEQHGRLPPPRGPLPGPLQVHVVHLYSKLRGYIGKHMLKSSSNLLFKLPW